jgi:isoquinoline 1-oxidoreductase subunit beta
MLAVNRRTFLKAGSGFVLACSLGLERALEAAPAPAPDFNLFLRIGSDDSITLLSPSSEMGQGVLTSLSMIVAEELEVELSRVRTEIAPADPRYGFQITGGSQTIPSRYPSLRTASAAAREMLAGAAAAEWKVPAEQCRAEGGKILGPGGKSATYGKLAARAVKVKPPAAPRLKDEKAFTLIGQPTKRVDTLAKVKGEATFGMDVKVPGMLTAVVARSPSFGGKVKSFDAAKAKAVPGVRQVVQIPTGVAVVADHFWAAKTGREALEVSWDEPNAELSSAAIQAQLEQLLPKGAVAHKMGDADKALQSAAKKLEATYEVPFLAHAAMEPLNATAHVRKDRCEIWAPTQSQGPVQEAAAKICGLPRESVSVRTTFLGGGFGRKAHTDYVDEAVHCSKATGKPIKVVYTREDDFAAGQYRPLALNRLTGALDAQGWPVAWTHQIASPSILAGTSFFGGLQGPIDPTSIEGAANLPYAIPNMRVTYAKADLPVSVWFWRSVGSSINAYVTECFFDELARLGGKDPVEARLKLLANHRRHRRVLEAAAEKIGWGKPAPSGAARGIAVHESFGSIVAEAAEVAIEKGEVRVLRVACAVDCGKVVNPSTIAAQMESAVIYGLSAALHGEISIDKGRPVQQTFYDYPVIRIDQAPKIETVLVPSGDAHGGIGEPGTPPAAPAVVNALLALTGKPIRKLPIRLPTT